MFDMATLTSFLGWCSVINVGLLLLSTAILLVFKEPIMTLHSRFFDIDRDELNAIYLRFLGHYKLAIIMLNIVPYFSLKLMY